jgi:predicted amidohydrolase
MKSAVLMKERALKKLRTLQNDDRTAEIVVAPISLDSVWEDRPGSCERAALSIKEVVRRGARLILLPEMFSTGFSMNTSVSAEDPADSPTLNFMKEMAAEHNVAIIGGYCVQDRDGRGRNVCAAIDHRGEVAGIYHKNHLFPVAGEPDHFSPGNGRSIVNILGMRIAMYICYDLRFPQDFRYRLSIPSAPDDAFMGIRRDVPMPPYDVITVIASWPASRDHHWRTLLISRAIENQAWVIACNRRGQGGGLLYCGSSMVIDPLGNIVAEDQKYRPWFIASLNIGMVDEIRGQFPIQEF